MPGWLTPEVLGALSPAVLCSLFVLMVLLGWIRPSRTVEEIREDRDARLADKDKQIEYLQRAIEKSEETKETQAEALRDALEVSEAVVEILSSIRNMASLQQVQRGHDTGDA